MAPASANTAPKTQSALGGAIANELQRKLTSIEAQLSANEEELGECGKKLRSSVAEASLVAESIESTMSALGQVNLHLERNLAERTAELEASENAHVRGEEHLRLIFESATEYAIFTLDLEGRVTSWNPGARRILGFDEGEILNRSGDIIFTPEDRTQRQAELEMCLAVEQGHAGDERWHLRADGSRFWAAGMMMPMLNADGELQGFLKILRDRTERRREEENRSLLLREMDHRIKNILATVNSVAAQTLRQADAPASLRATFDARLMALTRSHEMLVRGGWEGALLREAVQRTLEPYAADGEAGRISLVGPPVRLTPSVTITLNLALHELATNAAKYGALSSSGGHVDVSWKMQERRREEAPIVVILWRERGGPPVRPPKRRGFGSRLLERALPRGSGGDVKLDFAPQGVECHIRLPLVLPAENGGTPMLWPSPPPPAAWTTAVGE